MNNSSASVIARLKNYSRASALDFNLVSRLYMQEGLLKRIFRSEYSNHFYLKGGLLLFSISDFTSRPTQDIDLLGKNIPNDNDNLRSIISNIMNVEVDDCLFYDPDSIALSGITEGAEYQGKRIKMVCKLGTIRTVLKLDIGFGDSILTEAIRQTFLTRNTLLPDSPAVFSSGFGTAPRNRDLWQAFLKRIHAEVIPFEVVMRTISEQLKPIYQQLLQEAKSHS